MKGAKRHMKFMVVIFGKKIFLKVNWLLWGPKILCPQSSGSAFKDLFIIMHNKRGKEANEN